MIAALLSGMFTCCLQKLAVFCLVGNLGSGKLVDRVVVFV